MASFSDLIATANEGLGKAGQGKPIRLKDGDKARFEVYYAPFSVCSHKVRNVLAEKQVPYLEHRMNLSMTETRPPDCYLPGYVKMRMAGAPGAALVDGYTGRSSVESEGFDPCVVPTLIDHEKQRVIVDSARICNYVDQEFDIGPRLSPDNQKDAIEAQISLIDQAPHVAVLYGEPPDRDDDRPQVIAKAIDGVHDRKIKNLEALKATVDDPALIAAYDAKIAKEATAKDFIYTKSAMIEAHKGMKDHVAALEAQLNTHSGKWVMGDDYTMADIMWTISIFRLKWLGLGHLWETPGLAPRVSEYVQHAFLRPAFKDSVIDWPMSTPPSPHIEPSAPYAQTLHATWRDLAERRPSA
ncbi:MAG: glutathione S-transferase family protein [Pseudomonadota bacterium]